MISPEERRRLMERLGEDGANPLRAVLKCAAGIVVLLVIAAGPWTFLSLNRDIASRERVAAKADTAQEEGKGELEDERRDRQIWYGGDAAGGVDAKGQQRTNE